jgi:hypothetical protein
MTDKTPLMERRRVKDSRRGKAGSDREERKDGEGRG